MTHTLKWRKMINIKDDARYGALQIISESGFRVGKTGFKYRTVMVRCDCGNEETVPFRYLRENTHRACTKCIKKSQNIQSPYKKHCKYP